MTAHALRERVEALLTEDDTNPHDVRTTFNALRNALDDGTVRAAERSDDGSWRVHSWVKEGILLGFKIGKMTDMSADRLPFFDKDTYPLKTLTAKHEVRLVPGGSSIRSGSYVAPGVVCMPPMYINVGAYVDTGSMVDSHALVGSCAQVGTNVHLSAAAQVGGVLEPVGALPVIIEDDVFVGGGCGIYEGCLVRSGAVLAPGVTLTSSTTVYDLVHERRLRADDAGVLEIPENAVVVPGTRSVGSDFATDHGLALYAPVIVKYRDASTDAATSLEDALR